MKLTEHFDSSEFDCNAGTPVPKELLPVVQQVALELEILRAEFGGRPTTIISGYRTVGHNRRVGGAKNSQHLLGKAADIIVAGVSPDVVHATILRLIKEKKMRQGGVGKYKTFTHYDIRGTAARWSGKR